MEAAVGAADGSCCGSSGWRLRYEQQMEAAVGAADGSCCGSSGWMLQ
jgi:hypothetical protein